jgi:hypothetical protein
MYLEQLIADSLILSPKLLLRIGLNQFLLIIYILYQ